MIARGLRGLREPRCMAAFALIVAVVALGIMGGR
jgi:hypothetical protein